MLEFLKGITFNYQDTLNKTLIVQNQFSTSTELNENTPHEFGHWGGLDDIEGNTDEEWAKQGTHIMFNNSYRDEKITADRHHPDEFAGFYKSSGIHPGVTKGEVNLSPSKE